MIGTCKLIRRVPGVERTREPPVQYQRGWICSATCVGRCIGSAPCFRSPRFRSMVPDAAAGPDKSGHYERVRHRIPRSRWRNRDAYRKLAPGRRFPGTIGGMAPRGMTHRNRIRLAGREDPAIWGENFPFQFDDDRRTVDQIRPRFGGSEAVPRTPTDAAPRSLVSPTRIEQDTWLKTMWARDAFARDFREERGDALMPDEDLATPRDVLCKAQFIINSIDAEHSTGFHAPQEAARVPGPSIEFTRRGQRSLTRGRSTGGQ